MTAWAHVFASTLDVWSETLPLLVALDLLVL